MLGAQPFASVVAGDGPRIAATVVSGIRRTLVDQGTWPRIRARVLADRPAAQSWIDAALEHAWCPLDWHLAILSAVASELGERGVIEFGAARLRDNMRGGVLAPVLRSWMRSYGSAPGHLMRVAPHMWHAMTRGVGRVEVTETAARAVSFQIVGMPEAALRCTAWHRFLEGYGVALLEAGSHRGHVSFTLGAAPGQLDARVSW